MLLAVDPDEPDRICVGAAVLSGSSLRPVNIVGIRAPFGLSGFSGLLRLGCRLLDSAIVVLAAFLGRAARDQQRRADGGQHAVQVAVHGYPS